MCGIAGWFSPIPVQCHEKPRLAAMAEALRHRGPDGTGMDINTHAALAHTRLAVIDAGGGKQPMLSTSGRCRITFNGEIYNYRELKRGLERRGARFATNSDTEVILNLYEAEGWQGFSRLRGMFAFALWDEPDQLGLLVRDPHGIKPLFVHKPGNHSVAFASEAKAILAGGFEAALDEASLHLLMNFRYVPGDASLFRGIEQVSPGDVLLWKPGRPLARQRITTPRFVSGDVLDVLQDSVGNHLVADVEVGTYLSGGLDSATITALAKDKAAHPIRTFTIDAGDDPREAALAKRTAELLGVINVQGSTVTDIAAQLPRLVWHLEVPKINALQVNQVAQIAAREVKVVLSGLGGDEIFLGYNAHRIMYRTNRLAQLVPEKIARMMGAFSASLSASISPVPWSEGERACRMLQSMGNWPRVYGILRNVWDSPRLRQSLYGPRLLDAALPDAFDVIDTLWPKANNPLDAMILFERRQKLVNDLLWQEDRASMAEGLEVRVPFVDGPFMSRVQQLDTETLMPRGKLKQYMKTTVAPLLPLEVLNRPKSGFQVDSPAFFHQHLKTMAEIYLDDGNVRRIGLFNPQFVTQTLKHKPATRLRWHYFILYLMLLTHLWIETFEKRR